MNIVFTDNRVSDGCSKALGALGYVVIRLPSFWGLSEPVSSHPDMLLSKLKDGSILMCRDYYEIAGEIFSKSGVKVTVTDEKLAPCYPNDVLFDALSVGNTLYGKIGCVSRYLMNDAKRFVSVRQGYTRCSAAMLSDRCAVTSDPGIADALENDGMRVLRIRQGYIRLDGYDTGFIGGAGGRFPDGRYGFFGDITSHPDGEAIMKFAAENKITVVPLSDEPISDHGGMMFM